jgi:hypothetical protein
MTVCSTCGLEKPEDRFRPSRGTGQVRRKRQCLDCKNAAQRAWTRGEKSIAYRARYRQEHAEERREYSRLRGSEWRYGLTKAEIEQMAAEQDGRCLVCGKETALQVDHDHGTGRVRGLLCPNCNKAAGLLGDDPNAAVALAAYLVLSEEASHASQG